MIRGISSARRKKRQVKVIRTNLFWGGKNSGIDGGNQGGKGITDVPGGLKLQCEGHKVMYRNTWIKKLNLENSVTKLPSMDGPEKNENAGY